MEHELLEATGYVVRLSIAGMPVQAMILVAEKHDFVIQTT
jgi:hypothetical protein